MGGLSIGFVDLFLPAQFHSRATVLSKSHMETAAHLHGQSELANVSPDKLKSRGQDTRDVEGCFCKL